MNYQLHSQDYYDPSLELDFTQPWSPDSKKHGQIPRAASYYPASQSAVFDLTDDDWHRYAHAVPHYTDSSPPRIKQEDLYSEASIRYDQPQSQSQPQSQPQPQSFQPLLSPLQTHHPISHPTPYYSPSFHHQPQNQIHHLSRSSFQPFGGTIHPSELSPATDSCTSVSPLSAYTDLSGVVNVGHDSHFVCQPQHTIDLKSWNDDRRGSLASTASMDSDLSAHSHHSHHMVGLDMNMDQMDGMAMGMAGVVVGGMPIDMSGAVNEVCVPEEDVGGEEDAEGDDDWDHAQAQDPQQAQFQQAQQMEYMHESVEAAEDETERDGEGEDELELHVPADISSQQQQQQQQPQHGVDDDGEDEIPVEESDGTADVDGAGEAEIKREYEDSDLSETDEEDEEEDEDEDDPDDPEFVPRPRRRPSLRRQSTFPSADSELQYSSQYVSTVPFSNITGEGRNLRPRSSSARYTPYPSSYPETSSAAFYSNEHGFEHNDHGAYNERASGRRYNSTSSTTSSSTHPPRSVSSLSGSSGITTTTTATHTTRRRLRPSNTLPVPVPVPNLTKKSRGRRVPTMSSLEDVRSAASGAGKKRQSAGGKSARMYLCDVDGCGKCFARGEHLKRHVRSIHTYEKPHKCLYPGCGKDFSRHDNLGQHMRVHKDYVQEGVTVSTSATSSGTSASGSSRRKSTAQTQS